MTTNLSQTTVKVIGMGAVAGMRTMAAPAILSHFLSHSAKDQVQSSPLAYLQSSKVAVLLKVLAGAELIADKLPTTPDRIINSSILVRTLSGAVVGAGVSEANGQSKAMGALVGGLGAVAASYMFFYLRKATVQNTRLSDTKVALLEDTLAICLATFLMKDKR